MRIAHIITRLILGGAQENTLLTCEGLARRGDEVMLATGPAIGPEGSLIERAAAAPIRLEIVPEMRRAVHPRRDLAALGRLRRLIRDWKPEIVHTHSSKAGVIGRLAARLERVPLTVHTIHGLPFHESQSWPVRAFYRQCERTAAGWSDAIIAVADRMVEQARAAGIAPRGPFRTIYSGMETRAFLDADARREEMRAQLGFAADDLVVGKVARLFRLKGHDLLIEAAAQILAEQPRARFLLVGDGELRSALESEVAARGMAGRFTFTGLVPPGDVPGLIAAMDLLVHASHREGLARTLPQALLVGRPVVSFDVGGAREVVIDRLTGRLLTHRAPADLAAAVIEILTRPDRGRAMGAAGRRRCCGPFNADTMVDEIRDLYGELQKGGTA